MRCLHGWHALQIETPETNPRLLPQRGVLKALLYATVRENVTVHCRLRNICEIAFCGTDGQSHFFHAEAHGTPDDMLRDPFLETSLIDFVTDPEKAKPRFAGVATDPYGSGRHLLLPMFRRMQHEGSWCALIPVVSCV